MLNAIGLQNPGVDTVVGRDPAHARLHRDALFRERLRLDDRRLRRDHPTLRGFADRRDRDQTSRARTSRKRRAVRQRAGDVGTRGGRLPCGDEETADHQSCRRTRPTSRKNARRCIEAGSDALAVINTVMGMAIDVRTRKPVIGNIQGDCRDRPIKPIALLKVMQVAEVARPLGVPIIGPGRHLHGRRTRSSSSSPAPRRWASARRCSTTRWSARRSIRAFAEYLAEHGWRRWPNWSARSTRRRRRSRPAPAESLVSQRRDRIEIRRTPRWPQPEHETDARAEREGEQQRIERHVGLPACELRERARPRHCRAAFRAGPRARTAPRSPPGTA